MPTPPLDRTTDVDAALALQRRLAPLVRLPDEPIRRPRTIAGLDVSYSRDSDAIVAAVVLVDAATGRELESVTVGGLALVDYAPGLLALREAPSLLAALGRLETTADLLLCDGSGYAHPRRFGLACHLALATGIPAIGVAKTRFVGTHGPVGRNRGDRAPLTDAGELVGYALRTRDDVRPVYVSPGSGIGFEQSCELVLEACRTARLPDPIRAADHLGRLAVRS